VQITDCTVSGNVTVVAGGNNVGGFYGHAVKIQFLRTAVQGNVTVTGAEDVGGLVGQLQDGTIEESFSSGSVDAQQYVGGLVGRVRDGGEVKYSYAAGNVTAASEYAGGLVGVFQGSKISDSYSTGAVTGENRIGGLAGQTSGVIERSYSTGAVTASGPVFGGFRADDGATVSDSFWDLESSGLTVGRGTGEEGKTSEQMRTRSTYADQGWAIVAAEAFSATELTGPTASPPVIWGIGPEVNSGYPFLWWQTESGFLPVTASAPGSSSSSGSSSASSAAPAIHLDVQASVGSPVAGAPVVIGGQGLQPGSAYSLVVRSNPVTVTSGVASSSGSFSQRVTLPAGIAPGNHTITLTGIGSGGETLVLTQSFTVAANGTFSAIGPVTGSTTGGLAVTGVNPAGFLGGIGLAGMLALLGVSLLVAKRRALLH
jgi:hypothetical protein